MKVIGGLRLFGKTGALGRCIGNLTAACSTIAKTWRKGYLRLSIESQPSRVVCNTAKVGPQSRTSAAQAESASCSAGILPRVKQGIINIVILHLRLDHLTENQTSTKQCSKAPKFALHI